MNHRARRGSTAVAAILLMLAGAACAGGDRSSAPRSRVSGRALTYVALGGDDVYGGRGTADSWPQRLFRTQLPTRATFVNLASPRHGAAEVLRSEVEAARRLRPGLVTITLADDLERSTPPDQVAANLTRILGGLRAGKHPTVLVGTAPAGLAAPAATAAFDDAIRRGAAGTGATVVALGSVNGTDRGVAAPAIATAFARALPASARS